MELDGSPLERSPDPHPNPQPNPHPNPHPNPNVRLRAETSLYLRETQAELSVLASPRKAPSGGSRPEVAPSGIEEDAGHLDQVAAVEAKMSEMEMRVDEALVRCAVEGTSWLAFSGDKLVNRIELLEGRLEVCETQKTNIEALQEANFESAPLLKRLERSSQEVNETRIRLESELSQAKEERVSISQNLEGLKERVDGISVGLEGQLRREMNWDAKLSSVEIASKSHSVENERRIKGVLDQIGMRDREMAKEIEKSTEEREGISMRLEEEKERWHARVSEWDRAWSLEREALRETSAGVEKELSSRIGVERNEREALEGRLCEVQEGFLLLGSHMDDSVKAANDSVQFVRDSVEALRKEDADTAASGHEEPFTSAFGPGSRSRSGSGSRSGSPNIDYSATRRSNLEEEARFLGRRWAHHSKHPDSKNSDQVQVGTDSVHILCERTAVDSLRGLEAAHLLIEQRVGRLEAAEKDKKVKLRSQGRAYARARALESISGAAIQSKYKEGVSPPYLSPGGSLERGDFESPPGSLERGNVFESPKAAEDISSPEGSSLEDRVLLIESELRLGKARIGDFEEKDIDGRLRLLESKYLHASIDLGGLIPPGDDSNIKSLQECFGEETGWVHWRRVQAWRRELSTKLSLVAEEGKKTREGLEAVMRGYFNNNKGDRGDPGDESSTFGTEEYLMMEAVAKEVSAEIANILRSEMNHSHTELRSGIKAVESLKNKVYGLEDGFKSDASIVRSIEDRLKVILTSTSKSE